jgi:hypothetical protein
MIPRERVIFGLACAGLILLLFWQHLFQGASLLTLDVLHQGYLPWAKSGVVFDPQNHFESDSVNLLLQYKTLGAEALYRPYWNPFSMGGVPDYANPYASHFSIWNALFALFEPSTAFLWMVIAQLVVAASGMYALLRSQNVSPGWARIAALAFAFSGPMLTLSLRWWVPGAMGWACWALWSWRTRKPWAPVFLALAVTTGFIQTTVFVGAMTLVSALASDDRRLGVLRWARDWCFALGISAIALLPQLEFMLQDLAKGQSRVAHTGFQKSPLERLSSILFLFGAWIPEVWGTVRTLDFTKLIRTNLQDFSPFFGTIVVTLSALACVARIWRVRPVARVWAILLLIGLVLPILTPLDQFLYFRFLIVAIFGAVGLAAHYATSLEDRQFHAVSAPWLKRASWALGISSIGLSVLLLVWAFLHQLGWIDHAERSAIEAILAKARDSGGIFPSRFPEWMSARAIRWIESWRALGEGALSLGFTGVLGLASAALWFREMSFRRTRLPILAALALGLVMLQLAVFGARWFPAVNQAQAPLPHEATLEPWVKSVRAGVGEGRLYVDGIQAGRREIFPNNLGSILKIPTLNGFDGLKPFTALQLARGPEDLRGLGVTAILRFADSPQSPQTESREILGEVALDRIRSPLGIARVVSGYELVQSPDVALQRAWQLGFEGESVVLESKGLKDGSPSAASNPGARGTAQLTHRTHNGLEIEVQSDRAALLVMAETWYPGWRVEVNGKDQPVWRAQRALRAVEIPSGMSTVRWRFEPPSFRIGFVISLFSLLAFSAFLLVMRSREKGVAA